MKIVTWNVNSIRARRERLVHYLEAQRPEIVCLQETKVKDEAFPFEELEALGYHALHFGQGGYNGVAILRHGGQLELVSRGFDDGEDDPQTRFLHARADELDVLCAYVPNGESMRSEKYPYKKAWLRRLELYLRTRLDPNTPLVLCGDFNIAPEARDMASPKQWVGGVLHNPEVLEAWRRLLDWGLEDLFRQQHDDAFFSWWDYRRGAYHRNDGLRIDFVLGTAPISNACADVWIERDARAPDFLPSKPSDHAAVVADLDEVSLEAD